MRNVSRLAWLALCLAALPCAAQVDDDAKLFNDETFRQAQLRIKEIHERTGKQIMVYTLKTVPEEIKKKFDLDAPSQRKEAFDELAGKQLGKTDGILLLICEEPRHIQIVVSESTESLFGKWYQDHLRGRMIGKFQPDNPGQHFFSALRNKLRSGPNPNAGLLESVDYIAAKLDYNRPVDQTNLYLGLGIMGGMIGAWFVLGIFRTRLRKRTPLEAGVHGADNSGRSIAVLGGGIGAVSGQWFFSRLFARHTPDPEEAAPTVVETFPGSPPETPHG